MTSSGFVQPLQLCWPGIMVQKEWDRIKKGFFVSLGIVTGIGIGATFLFYFLAQAPYFQYSYQKREALKTGYNSTLRY